MKHSASALAKTVSILRATLCLGVITLLALSASAETITQDFTSDPLQQGWQIFGETNLFSWDSTNHNLGVTWNSDLPNSYFYHRLNNTLGAQDGFSLEFDINLSSQDGGTNAAQLAIGFLNFANATDPGFQRDSGYQSPNLAEFDYFLGTDTYGPTIASTTLDTGSLLIFRYDFTVGMTNGTTYHVLLNHAVGDTSVIATVFTYDTNGVPQLYSSLPYIYSQGGFGDFFVDTVSINNYNDAVPDFYGSVHAQGTVSKIKVTTNPQPIGNLKGAVTNGHWQVTFSTRTGWDYVLQKTGDFKSWTSLSTNSGFLGIMTLHDTNAVSTNAFYRVIAEPQILLD